MGGGPSSEQKQAAQSQANMTNQLAGVFGREQDRLDNIYNNYVQPFSASRMQNGLPFNNALTDFTSGTTAQAFAPAKANLARSLNSFGSLPSGFATQARSDLGAQQARAFDSGMVQNLMGNETAKQNAAGMLVGQQQIANPLGAASTAMQGNSSIMQAPLAKPGLGGMLGGMLGGGMAGLGF